MDVEKTIEFILDQQARLQSMMIERDAAGLRTDARLDRAIRMGVQELRRERQRRQELKERGDDLDARLGKLADTVQRYIDSRGNGHNGHA